MSFSEISYRVSRGVAIVTLSRPNVLNAWTPTMGAEVRQAMRGAVDDHKVRVIVLTGAGRGFCSGADMNRLNTLSDGNSVTNIEEGAFENTSEEDFQHKYTYFPAVSKPMIAAINGPCAGLGLCLALFCDIRFASDNATFATAFAKRGLIAEHGISWTLPRVVGFSAASDLLLSGRKIDAVEAKDIGLVNKVYRSEDLVAEALAYAAELGEKCSPRSTRVIKKQLWAAQMQTLDQAIKVADIELKKSLESDDFREGVKHFVEKREPAFTGR